MSIFSIDYGSGHISVNVNNYFAKANLPNIKKLFKLARDFCTDEQRNTLINAVRNSKIYWQQMFEKRTKNYTLENDITNLLTPSTPKQSIKLQQKLDRVIEILTLENWKNEKSEH